ncbi:class III lanthionine synthetase LanKC [Thermoactinospora rubra]|uniref:class III lanthionine synthetase LanKC n=1 Tax=Thermoactinospora rubra TaxID=1088767 RepID=UPI000A10B0D1|nr:class III lanthionine synthetase LanKC [Thermoactinospora rubra]
MDQYELYCLADPLFYDVLHDKTAEATFAAARRPVPDGWSHHATDTWMYYAPEGEPLPLQGWKIHVSAKVDHAERAVATVWDYCVPRGIAFKFLRGVPVLVMLGSKAASRASSGKLVTVYPRDEAQLELALKDLNELLRGVEGPYILSDLRYGDGPLYVRYGGFAERHCLSEAGERVLAVEDGQGRLVPDVRHAVFSVPPWTTLPEFLQPHLAARNAVTTEGLPYKIEKVLHFSNGGGVYLAEDLRTGRRVVLKEARPHAGLDAAGRDAVARLTHERDIMRRLAGLPAVPELIDDFTLGEHSFLVQEFVDGVTLQRRLVHRFPLTKATCTRRDLEEYAAWALETAERVERAVDSLHGRGVVFGDLHPDNVLLTESGRVVLIDYEVATLADEQARSALAHPAFAAPADRQGVEVDRYALACLRLGLFAPQCTIMQPLHRAKARHLGEIVTDVFPVPPQVIRRDVDTIAGRAAWEPPPMPGEASWPELRDAMARAIVASATPDRDDRLFPGDIAQFQPGRGLSLAYGAAGVLYALARAGCEPVHAGWLARHAKHPRQGSGLGLYDGLAGVAYVLDVLGHRQDALDVLEICLREDYERLESALLSGLPGIGLTLYHFGRDDLAARVVDICADRLGGVEDVPELSGGSRPRAGLMYGSSGPALLFLHAYERTGDGSLLDLAETALRQDLRRCRRADDGSLQVNQGWRLLPYLDEGSAGIAMVLARHLTHRPHEELADALARLRLVARSGFFVQSGLFTGRAGIVAAFGSGAAGLRWHALPYGGGLAFPGDQLLRLSMDLATGTAGVLLALASAHAGPRAGLPFLDERREV